VSAWRLRSSQLPCLFDLHRDKLLTRSIHRDEPAGPDCQYQSSYAVQGAQLPYPSRSTIISASTRGEKSSCHPTTSFIDLYNARFLHARDYCQLDVDPITRPSGDSSLLQYPACDGKLLRPSGFYLLGPRFANSGVGPRAPAKHSLVSEHRNGNVDGSIPSLIDSWLQHGHVVRWQPGERCGNHTRFVAPLP